MLVSITWSIDPSCVVSHAVIYYFCHRSPSAGGAVCREARCVAACGGVGVGAGPGAAGGGGEGEGDEGAGGCADAAGEGEGSGEMGERDVLRELMWEQERVL